MHQPATSKLFSRRDLAGAVLAGVLSMALYVRTMVPWVLPFDSGEFQVLAYQVGLAHGTGYAVYMLIAKLFITLVPVRDVAYRVHADLEVLPGAAADNTPIKFQEMFERRASKGQCVNQPYLGCREFAAAFRLVADPGAEPEPIPETRDLGFMLHDLDFAKPSDPLPRFFRAEMKNGVVDVPAWNSAEVRG